MVIGVFPAFYRSFNIIKYLLGNRVFVDHESTAQHEDSRQRADGKADARQRPVSLHSLRLVEARQLQNKAQQHRGQPRTERLHHGLQGNDDALAPLAVFVFAVVNDVRKEYRLRNKHGSNAHARKDIAYIKSLPGIGAKTASQMILDLKGKLPESQESMIENPKLNDVIDALKALGYRQNEINPVINKIKGEDLSVDEYIKKALALMLKQR